MPDFPLSPLPDYPIEETPANPEVLISRHRDGSEQRRLKGAGDGAQFRLSYGGSCPITRDDRDAIVSHFGESNGALNSFGWTHPETEDEYLVRYIDAPAFRLVGYDAYVGEVRLKVVTE
jgi:phage-related protein